MGRHFLIDLEGDFYSCRHCQTPLALAEHLLSAPQDPEVTHWIFNEVVNVSFGEGEDHPTLVQGLPSTKMDVFCVNCGSKVGWRIESDFEEVPGYMFDIERSKILHTPPPPPPPPPSPPPQDDA